MGQVARYNTSTFLNFASVQLTLYIPHESRSDANLSSISLSNPLSNIHTFLPSVLHTARSFLEANLVS